VRVRREGDIATRRRPLTGLSEFPRLADPPPGHRNLTYRWGAAFEALRAVPPAAHVFLATLGTVAAHTERAGFVTHLFGAGGVAVDVAGATSGVDDLVAAYAGQPVACLAGSDAAYARWGSDAAASLRSKGATYVAVVGSAQPWADDSFRDGDNVLDFLDRTREALR
jgi:methylmalonyl-CoA mutase